MLNITFDEKKMKLTFEGHANYAEKGKDILCSSASILFYTLKSNLEELDKTTFETMPVIIINKNFSSIECKPKEEYQHLITVIYKTILKGIYLLAENYKNFIKFSYVEG